MDSLFDTAHVMAAGMTVLHSLWQATVLAAILYLVARHPRPVAQTRYALGYTLLCLQVLISAVTYAHYFTPSPATPALSPDVPAVGGYPAVVATAPWYDFLAVPEFWLAALVVIWLVGMLVGSSRLAWSYLGLRRLSAAATRTITDPAYAEFRKTVAYLARRIGYHGRIQLGVTDRVRSPMLLGHLRPVLVFPIAMINQLSLEETESVILHELAHLRRYDHWLNFLQSLVEVLFYYHPAMHWISARVREEREYCCDDLVLEYGPGGLPYARALLYYGEAEAFPVPAGLGLTDGSGLLLRVRRFLNQQEITYKMKSRILLLPLIALTVIAVMAVYDPGEPGSTADAFPTEVLAIDSLPRGLHEVTRLTNGKTTRLRVEDGEIRELELEGRVIPEEEYSDYEEEAERILGISKERQRGRPDTVIVFDPRTYQPDTIITFDGGSARGLGSFDGRRNFRIYTDSFPGRNWEYDFAESMEALEGAMQNLEDLDLDFDFDVDFEALHSEMRDLHIDMDSLHRQMATFRIDGDVEDMLLHLRDAEGGWLDSLHIEELNGLRDFEYYFRGADELNDVEALEAREKALREELERVEERKRELKKDDKIRGEALIDRVRADREYAMAEARRQRHALRRQWPAAVARSNGLALLPSEPRSLGGAIPGSVRGVTILSEPDEEATRFILRGTGTLE